MLNTNGSLKIMWGPWSHDLLTSFSTLEQLRNDEQCQILFVFLFYCVCEWVNASWLQLGCVYNVKEVYAVRESLSTVYVSEKSKPTCHISYLTIDFINLTVQILMIASILIVCKSIVYTGFTQA